MGSPAVVVVDEAGQCVEPRLVRVVAADVGPLCEQGLVEALGLAVGLGPERAGPLVPGADFGQGCGEGVRVGVVLGVVGQDPLDPDAMTREEKAAASSRKRAQVVPRSSLNGAT